MEEKKTAAYKITPDTDGNRYRFYCDISGALPSFVVNTRNLWHHFS